MASAVVRIARLPLMVSFTGSTRFHQALVAGSRAVPGNCTSSQRSAAVRYPVGGTVPMLTVRFA
ncbi:hypothetical protein E2C05_13355 [Paracraurococcus ruber]|uniref:hypothetical protein n=1 Tax=Paracraurococcus ruber TaxID=77675 RepID=UPI0013051053|nr:hypothetical protein [Paracraurococcus ruber]TDG30712.1 hypothetical protein E2C05_13355 [Paracraurococcus ruber]